MNRFLKALKVPIPWKWILVLLGVVILFVIAAGAYWPIPRHYDLKVSGRVLDEHGVPISGAVVGAQLMRRCGSLGGGSTSGPIARFRSKTNSQGEFQLAIRGHYWGYSSILTLTGCSTSQDRFVCKPGFDPILDFNYMNPDELLQGTVEKTYTLKMGPPTRAASISFMTTAKDALDCQ